MLLGWEERVEVGGGEEGRRSGGIGRGGGGVFGGEAERGTERENMASE